MTLHISYDHQCPQCSVYYIPYDDTVPCPGCAHLEQERFDFISEAVASVRYNLEIYQSYIPPGWYTSSLGDHILQILFGLLEQYKKPGKQSFSSFAQAKLKKMDWGDQTYLCNHIHAIAVRVYDEFNRTRHEKQVSK